MYAVNRDFGNDIDNRGRKMAKSERAPLDQPSIVAAANALADSEGIDAVTMRKLAETLGYKVMALYTHVANKDELLGLMVDAVAGEIEAPPPDLAPLEALRASAIAARTALVAHPWAPGLWLRHFPGPARIDHMELLLRTLDSSGLSPHLAHQGFHAISNHVLGYTLQELDYNMVEDNPDDPMAKASEFMAGMSQVTHPFTIAHVQQHIDGDTAASFELVLDLILQGLVRLNDEN